MSFAVFSERKDGNGGAFIAKCVDKDNCVLLSLFKQKGTNANKKDNFDYKSPLYFKLNLDEVADIARVVREQGNVKFYHKFEDNTTTGSFSYYKIEAKGDKPERSGFGFAVTKDDVTIKVGLTLGLAERFAEFMRWVLFRSFDASQVQDELKEKEYQEKLKSKSKSSKSKSESEKMPDDEDDSKEDKDPDDDDDDGGSEPGF